MKNSKKIELLFQQKLRNLEKKPDEKVWNNISSKLIKKKKRVLPFWWFYGGVAALFILGFYLFKNTNNIETPLKIDGIENITNTNKSKKNNSIDATKSTDSIYKKTLENNLILITQQNNSVSRKDVIKKNSPQRSLNKLKKHQLDSDEKIAIENESITKSKNDTEKKLIDKKEIINKQISTDLSSTVTKIEASKKNDFLKDQENTNLKKQKKSLKRWTIAPAFAILNSNSFSDSSPLSSNLNNSTQGENSYSYGIKVSYRLNSKWSIQSGIHVQDINYVNKNVIIVASQETNSNINFNSGANFALVTTVVNDVNSNIFSLSSPGLSGDLSQQFGYIEIPLEIKYHFLNRKSFNAQLVAGFSSLFLNKNEITLSTLNNIENGEANNLNRNNFSGNFGVDFTYEFTKSWSFNLNPMIKAQLNTFQNNSNGFKPYLLGVYSGISFKF